MIMGFLALCLTTTFVLTMATTSTASPSDSPHVPIGAIIPWAKNLTGVQSLSDDFVECSGQTLNDTESPLHGQVIPNLNGFDGGRQRFLRGATSSGNTGGSELHNHMWLDTGSIRGIDAVTVLELRSFDSGGNPKEFATDSEINGEPFYTDNESTLPSYYEVVWIMRVKHSAPESVGGFHIPVDKFSLLAPYVILAITLILAVSISAAYIKTRKKQ